jgi:hypothetical protein
MPGITVEESIPRVLDGLETWRAIWERGSGENALGKGEV